MWGIAKAFACFLNKLHKFKKLQKTDSTTPHVTRKFLQARVKKRRLNKGLLEDYNATLAVHWLLLQSKPSVENLNLTPSYQASYARRSLPQVPSICNSFCT